MKYGFLPGDLSADRIGKLAPQMSPSPADAENDAIARVTKRLELGEWQRRSEVEGLVEARATEYLKRSPTSVTPHAALVAVRDEALHRFQPAWTENPTLGALQRAAVADDLADGLTRAQVAKTAADAAYREASRAFELAKGRGADPLASERLKVLRDGCAKADATLRKLLRHAQGAA